MATYAIGDIQGCYKSLKRLLKRIDFNETQDRLFLVGDLVNRGPNSLDVLRFACDMGDRVTAVLGNHDIHLLGVAFGVKAVSRKRRNFEKILRAKDCSKLIEWLRMRPLLYKEGRTVMVHAGILPAWSIEEAVSYAKEVEKVIRSKKIAELISHAYKTKADKWSDDLEDEDRLVTIINVLTRMRMCESSTKMDFEFVGTPDTAPKTLIPWFEWPERRNADHMIIFGHWAALGLRIHSNIISLDTGCVWGEALTAVRLEDGAIFSQPSVEK